MILWLLGNGRPCFFFFGQDNHFLGDFAIDNLPPAPKGAPQVEVTFDIDATQLQGQIDQWVLVASKSESASSGDGFRYFEWIFSHTHNCAEAGTHSLGESIKTFTDFNFHIFTLCIANSCDLRNNVLHWPRSFKACWLLKSHCQSLLRYIVIVAILFTTSSIACHTVIHDWSVHWVPLWLRPTSFNTFIYTILCSYIVYYSSLLASLLLYTLHAYYNWFEDADKANGILWLGWNVVVVVVVVSQKAIVSLFFQCSQLQNMFKLFQVKS